MPAQSFCQVTIPASISRRGGLARDKELYSRSKEHEIKNHETRNVKHDHKTALIMNHELRIDEARNRKPMMI